MRRAIPLLLLGLSTLATAATPGTETDPTPPVALVVHGGAGSIHRDALSAEREAEYRAGLRRALAEGHAVLRRGGTALDAVEAAIRVMEDSPLFNAGKGAVFTADGRNELDASIMVGSGRAGIGRAGAVANVTTVRNPIAAARAVMERTPHVLVVGAGAEALARREGLAMVEPGYFFTRRRWEALERMRREQKEPEKERGTVGAVALDASGVLAAGTSTGGMTNKLPGRVGDSPLIGAGTWADTRCAVSATGDGEYFIRLAIARTICARVELADEPIETAARHLIHGDLAAAGGGGGIIALERHPHRPPTLHWTFNTAGMFRGSIDQNGTLRIGLYGGDDAVP